MTQRSGLDIAPRAGREGESRCRPVAVVVRARDSAVPALDHRAPHRDRPPHRYAAVQPAGSRFPSSRRAASSTRLVCASRGAWSHVRKPEDHERDHCDDGDQQHQGQEDDEGTVGVVCGAWDDFTVRLCAIRRKNTQMSRGRSVTDSRVAFPLGSCDQLGRGPALSIDYHGAAIDRSQHTRCSSRLAPHASSTRVGQSGRRACVAWACLEATTCSPVLQGSRSTRSRAAWRRRASRHKDSPSTSERANPTFVAPSRGGGRRGVRRARLGLRRGRRRWRRGGAARGLRVRCFLVRAGG